MTKAICRLCLNNPAIENSHIISGFVLRAIKADSQTGFFRNPFNPNQRLQDGDKCQLLCTDCEQRFGRAENQFAQRIFSQFHSEDRDTFSYGPWLHYFMTSLAWRTLILDLPGLTADDKNPRVTIKRLADAAETMRLYLMGANNLASSLNNHAIVCTRCHAASARLAAIGPNVAMRRSVGGYTVLDRQNGYSAILHNIAGFQCFLIVKGSPRDVWNGTKVDPLGGDIRQPQRVSSWLVYELLEWLTESALKQREMSAAQLQVVMETAAKRPPVPSRRFWELDKQINIIE
jgi:hypothetical protein